MTKKLFSLLLALVIVCGAMCALPLSASAAESGTCGDNLTWALDDSGTLTISGTGNMEDYCFLDNTNRKMAPWQNYAKSITSVNINRGVTNIGKYAFYNCTAITNATISNSVTSIGDLAFLSCSSLKSITIPDSVTSIGLGAFDNTAYYNDPENWTGDVLYIGNHLIDSKISLKGAYDIRADTKTIADGAFDKCILLKSITIPDSVTSIGDYAFHLCRSLTSVTIPNSVTSIGNWTFEDCSSLTSIIMPDSVTNIGWFVFINCDKCTIYGNDGSYAQEYAKENNIPFVAGTTVGDIFFIDVVPDEWYVSAVQYAVDNKLFFGVSDNEFAPDVAMNRAMLVTVLWRLEGKPTVSAENTFTDVPADEWYTNAVIWASENGVVYGTGDGKFSPEDSITREQMAAILYRYAQKKGYDVTASTNLNTFPDGGKASSYARDALSWTCGADLIFGSDGKLLPQDGATRAQVAAILMRYTKKVVQK